jgi:hypothetical protein
MTTSLILLGSRHLAQIERLSKNAHNVVVVYYFGTSSRGFQVTEMPQSYTSYTVTTCPWAANC